MKTWHPGRRQDWSCGDNREIVLDGFVKSPDAALRCILRHCGVHQVRLIPQDLRALPAIFLRSRPKFKVFATFYEFVVYKRDQQAVPDFSTCTGKNIDIHRRIF
jgi:hypothetical protein